MSIVVPGNEGLSAQDVLAFVESGGSKTFVVASEAPEVVAARIDAEIFAAASLDALLGGSEITKARDYLNRPFTLLDVTFRPSEIEGEGLPFFVILTASTIDGEVIKISTGARSVVIKVAKIALEGWLPANVKLIEGNKTSNGYTPLDIVAGVIHEAF